MEQITKPSINLDNISYYSELVQTLKEHRSVNIDSKNEGFVSTLIYYLIQSSFFPVLISDSEFFLENTYDTLSSFCNEKSLSFLPYYQDQQDRFTVASFENHYHNLLLQLRSDNLKVIFSTSHFPTLEVYTDFLLEKYKIHLKIGESYHFDWLQSMFEEFAYTRVGIVEHNGEYNIRGGIIDIYPYGSTYPVRIEFFGDIIESVRSFNPNSQLSIEEQNEFILYPSLSALLDKRNILHSMPENVVFILLDQPNAVLDSFYSISFKKEQSGLSEKIIDQQKYLLNIEDMAKGLPHQLAHSEFIIYYDSEKHKQQLTDYFAHNKNQFIKGSISSGFYIPQDNVFVLSSEQLFHVEHVINPNKRFIPDYAEALESPSSLKYGDYVIHSDHGVGVYLGMSTIDHGGGKEDVVTIEYKNNDKVYVPLRHINKVYKYSSSESYIPEIGSLRNTRWSAAKSKAKSSAKEIAKDLVTLYTKRFETPGFSFHSNSEYLDDLKASFDFTETPDQDRTINEIYRDMDKPIIMDRLVCGDVGFGKTEVAIRAAFKAILSGKQVAVLVPTTILSIQHYETFSSRLKDFGANVELVNRFKTKQQMQRIYSDLSSGKIDILIGTHKLLSSSFIFHDLGLLIVDEEHRFGVRHKEKVKLLKSTVDVISMTATPIPRTLEFSLMGLRDISKIETAPKERMPINTKIMYWNTEKITEAIQRELRRNGQIIILNNDIHSLPSLESRIQTLVPTARIHFAHGQMKGPELEKRLIDFYHHKYDILIATTIIESGIDIPNANTLIVIDSHKFGLSQLYQIRGRVGRSHRRAYAYLIIPRQKHLTPAAEKRLRTLEYYTDLGSGYQIAMRDLQIRGGGNLFGTTQSGFINNVGYEYYMKIITDEIAMLKSGESDAILDYIPEITLAIDTYIPDKYINNNNIKFDQYRMISRCKNLNDLDKVKSSMWDRFGKFPHEVENLFIEKTLSIYAKTYYIEKCSVNQHSLSIHFLQNIDNKILQEAAAIIAEKTYLLNSEINFNTQGALSAKILFKEIDPLEFAESLLKPTENSTKELV